MSKDKANGQGATDPTKIPDTASQPPAAPQKLQSEADLNTEQFSDRYLFWMIARFIRPYWRGLALVFLMLIGVTGLSLLPPYLVQRAVDGPITSGNLNGLWPYGIIYFVSILILFGLRFGHTPFCGDGSPADRQPLVWADARSWGWFPNLVLAWSAPL